MDTGRLGSVTIHVPSVHTSNGESEGSGTPPLNTEAVCSAALVAPAVGQAPAHAQSPITVCGSMTQYKTPKNALISIIKTGMAKADLPWYHVFWLGVYAGAYIALGALLSIVVAGGLSTAAGGVAVTGTLLMPATGTNATAVIANSVSLSVAVPLGLVKVATGAVFPIGLMLVVICGESVF